jgi:hypothetical protein
MPRQIEIDQEGGRLPIVSDQVGHEGVDHVRVERESGSYNIRYYSNCGTFAVIKDPDGNQFVLSSR